MKALKLTIQAFGPFAKTQKIDFSLFGETSLYLINGNTGSGKTTILDAINFALYGDTTGKEREASDMRCDYADASLPTEVIFEFQLSEKIYRIQRMPKQEIKKSRGEGSTTKAAEANLWEVTTDGESSLLVPRKVSEVTKKIIELMGLNSEQFRQVMVLPQGRFRELLLANSTAREDIFSQLFQTQVYKQVEEDIKAQAKVVKERIEAYYTKMTTILETADLNSETEVEQTIVELAPEHKAKLQQKIDVAKCHKLAIEENQSATNLYQQFESLSTKQAELVVHQRQKSYIDDLKVSMNRALVADKLRPIFDSLQTVIKEKNRLETQLVSITLSSSEASQKRQEAEQNWHVANTNAQALDALNREQDKLQGYQLAIHNLELAYTQMKAVRKTAETTQKSLSQSLFLSEQKKSLQQQSEQRLEALTQILNDDSQLKLQENNLAIQIAALQEYEKQETRSKHKEVEGSQAKKDLEQAFQELQASQTVASKLEIRWHLGQAAVLASTLEDGNACPVCGSFEHPNPTAWQNPELEVDEAQLEAAKTEVTTYQQAHAQAENRLTVLRTEYTTMKSTLDKLAETLQGNTLGNLEVLQNHLKDIQVKISLLDVAKVEQAELRVQLQDLKQQLQNLETQIKIQQLEANTQQTQAQLKEQAWKAIQTQVPEAYRDSATLLLDEIQNLQNQMQNLRQAQEGARVAFDEAKSRADKAQQSLENAEQQLKDLTQKFSDCEQQWQVSLEASEFIDEAEFIAAQWAQSEFEAQQQTIHSFEQLLNQLNGALQQLNTSLEGKVIPDLTEVIERVERTTIALQLAENEFNVIDQRMALLKSVREKIAMAQQQNQILIEEYKLIGTLSEVLSGKEGDKVNLQRFVLSLLLDDVLQIASQHLRMMSKGRYELVRKEERSKGNKASGLDLDILDTWNDNSRGVATLSGGESFMAALSLALGLSDVVQSYSGGIKLDTLFIDEGFGSLDQESLDLSIETLKQLQASGRSIGIISHVSELKEQMSNRIDVHASNFGSTVKLIA